MSVFFTGFPGFIATQLMARLAADHTELAALIIPADRQKAEQQAAAIEEMTGCPEIRLIEGDITKQDLGLSEVDLRFMHTKKWTVWHLAAVYDLAVPKDLAWSVNVVGTENMNQFVRSLPELERYMYFSTAYVAGVREGRLYEHELVRPMAFKNFYEETKFEAEVLVDALKAQLPVTIIRPGIVRGSEESGETVKFDGPYFFLNMIDRLSFLPFIPFIGRSHAYINVVPIDYILEASLYLSTLPEASSKTVHLTDPNPHPVEEVYRAMVYEMTGKYPAGRFPRAFAAAGMKVAPIRKYLRVEAETLDYMTWESSFDTAVATALLQDSGIRCADFLETMPAMVEFYKAHKHEENFQIHIH